MILTDVNILVYAHRRDATHHEPYAEWLAAVCAGDEIALTDVTLTGFLRVVTNPRIFARPATIAQAMSFVDRLLHAPRARWLSPTGAAWAVFAEIAAADGRVRGNLVPDAWLAALARAHGCRLATADRGFARFAALDWFDPVRR